MASSSVSQNIHKEDYVTTWPRYCVKWNYCRQASIIAINKVYLNRRTKLKYIGAYQSIDMVAV